MWVSKDGDIRRQEFINAALEVFSEIGYEKASINDILKKVGVTKGSFYYYFTSKAEILAAAATQQAEELIEIIKNAADGSQKGAVQKINDVFSEIFEYRMKKAENHSELLLVLKNRCTVLLDFEIFMNIVEKAKTILAGIIAGGVREGAFDTAYPEEAAELCINIVNIMKNTLFTVLSANADKEETGTQIRRKVSFYEESFNRILGAKENGIRFSDLVMKYADFVSGGMHTGSNK